MSVLYNAYCLSSVFDCSLSDMILTSGEQMSGFIMHIVLGSVFGCTLRDMILSPEERFDDH